MLVYLRIAQENHSIEVAKPFPSSWLLTRSVRISGPSETRPQASLHLKAKGTILSCLEWVLLSQLSTFQCLYVTVTYILHQRSGNY